MTQDEINQGEWNKLENWGAWTYSSRADSRIIVPRRRCLGWTINFGRAGGKLLFGALLALPLVVFLGAWFFGKR